MSGEMNTSLGNGFTNLMMLLFLAYKKGCTDVKCVVEGDDSAARFTGPRPTAEDFAQLGMKCKVEFHENIETMSFCGLVFDDQDLINVTDPREVLATFGWTSSRYLRSNHITLKKLLRCKALSLAHQYPGCPIISSLAQYGLRVTRGIDVRHFIREKGNFSLWEREQLLEALKDEKKIQIIKPPSNTRMLVERLYNVTVPQQLKLEAYLDSLVDLRPIPLGEFIFNAPADWEDYFHKYVRLHDLSDTLDLPAGFPQIFNPEFAVNENYVPSHEEWFGGASYEWEVKQ